MINGIKNNILIKNFSSLTVLQISNYIFPLLTFPYLVRVLGPDNYGLISFAAAFAAYFNVLTDYGFNLSGTRLVSIYRNNKQRLNEIFSTVLIIRLLLFLIGGVLYSAIVISVDRFNDNYGIFLLSYLIVFGTAVSAHWFLQGLEKMKYITYVNIIVRTLWASSIFIFVQNKSDIFIAVLLNGVSAILIGLLNMYAAVRIVGLQFKLPSWEQLEVEFREGWYVFLSTASITLYTNSNVFILGLFASNETVGYFAAADKLRMAIQGLFQNAASAIYPRLSELFAHARNKAIKLVKKYLKLSISVSAIVTVILFLFSEKIVLFVLGANYVLSIFVFRIIVFLPIIILLSNVYGIQIMLNLGYNKEFFRVIILAGITNIILSLIFVPIYHEIGTSIVVLITETIVTFGMFIFVKNKKLLNEI